MLKINANAEKKLTFEVQLGGITDYENLRSYFRLVFNEVEYGFPARVTSNSISLTLPPLNKVIGSGIKEGDEAEIRLEVIADGHYLTPWSDRAKLSNPLIVEAKIRDDNFIPNPALETRLVVEEDGAKQSVTLKEKKIDPSDDIVNKVVEKLAQKLSPVKEEKEEDEKDEKVEEQKVVKEEKVTKPKQTPGKKTQLTEFKHQLTKEHILRYMEGKGTKNPKIQKIIYEQAEAKANGSRPFDIFKQVVKLIEKNKKS